MIRARHAAVLVPALLSLGACASLGGAGEPATADSIAPWVEHVGIAPELVHVTDVEGFALVAQSVGVWGDDGMSAVYLGDDGGTVLLGTARTADPTAVACADLPDSAEPALRCSVERDGVHVLLEGEGVEPAVLRSAAEAVRVPAEGELDALFAELPEAPQAPVERGDLPPDGDGAPDNEVGVGG